MRTFWWILSSMVVVAAFIVGAVFFAGSLRGYDAQEEVTACFAEMPFVEKAEWSKAVKDGEGRVFTVYDLVVTFKDNDPEPMYIDKARVVTKGNAVDEHFLPLYLESISLTGVSVKVDDTDMKVGSLQLVRPRGMRLGWDELEKTIQQNDQLLAFVTKYSAFESLLVSDVSFKEHNSEFRLKRMDMNGYGQARLEGYQLKELFFNEVGDITVTLDSYVIRGLDFGRILEFKDMFGWNILESLFFGSIDMDYSELRNLTVLGDEFKVDLARVTLDGVEKLEGLPSAMSLTVDGLEISAPFFRNQLFLKGIPVLDIHFGMTFRYEPETRQMHMPRFSFGESHMFSADFALVGEDVDLPDLYRTSDPVSVMYDSPLSLFRLRFTDKSLVRRYFEMEMRDKDKTLNQVVDKAVEEFRDSSIIRAGGEKARPLVDAVEEFLRNPGGVIVCTVRPNPPLKIDDFDPLLEEHVTPENFERLNMTIELE